MKAVNVDDVLKILHKYGKYIFVTDEKRYSSMADEIANLKALEQEPCEDWYDVPSNEMTLEQARQAVKDLREKLAEYLEQEPCDMKQRVEKEYLYESLCEDLKKANAEIKRLSEPFEDTISRQAVDELSKELVHTTRDKADFLCNFWEGLQKLPPVTPKEKTGRWISFGIQGEIDGQIVRAFTCSECGAISIFRVSNRNIVNGDLCPNCGAKMVEP